MFPGRFHPRGFSPPRRFSRCQAPGFLHPMPDRIRIVSPLPSEDSLPPLQVARSSSHLPTEMRSVSLARVRLGLRAHGFPIRSHPSKNLTLQQQPLHHCKRLPSCRLLRPPVIFRWCERPRLQGLDPLSRSLIEPSLAAGYPTPSSSMGFCSPLQGTSKRPYRAALAERRPTIAGCWLH